MGPRVRAWRYALVTAGGVVAIDHASKQIVLHSLRRGERVDVFFGLDVANVRNKGVAFGALASGGTLVAVLTLAAIGALVTYFRLRPAPPLLCLPVGVIAGGPLANLADRARDGAVIDWSDPVAWPAFNLADVAIV